MRFRVSSIGKPNLDRLYEIFIRESYDVRVRRSAKLKLMSQFSVVLPIQDTFPIEAISVLRELCVEMNIEWSQKFSIGYAADETNSDLPGNFELANPFWKAGYSMGKTIGKITNFFKTS